MEALTEDMDGRLHSGFVFLKRATTEVSLSLNRLKQVPVITSLNKRIHIRMPPRVQLFISGDTPALSLSIPLGDNDVTSTMVSTETPVSTETAAMVSTPSSGIWTLRHPALRITVSSIQRGTFVMSMMVAQALLTFSDTRSTITITVSGVVLLFKVYEPDPNNHPYSREKICTKILHSGPQVSMAISGVSSWGTRLSHMMSLLLLPHERPSSHSKIAALLRDCMRILKKEWADSNRFLYPSTAIVTFYDYAVPAFPIPYILKCQSQDLSVRYCRAFACGGTGYTDVMAHLAERYTYFMPVTVAMLRGRMYVRLATGTENLDRILSGHGGDSCVGGEGKALIKFPSPMRNLSLNLGTIQPLYKFPPPIENLFRNLGVI